MTSSDHFSVSVVCPLASDLHKTLELAKMFHNISYANRGSGAASRQPRIP